MRSLIPPAFFFSLSFRLLYDTMIWVWKLELLLLVWTYDVCCLQICFAFCLCREQVLLYPKSRLALVLNLIVVPVW